MVKDNRVTYRRRHSYNTVSNRVRKVKTPGSRIVVHYVPKRVNRPHCAECSAPILGVPAVRPKALSRMAALKRSVNRAYGGHLCATCVRDRVIRAFLIEEQKIVKKVLATKKKAPKK